MSAGPVIRRAAADELDACAALYERVLRETFHWTRPETHQAADFLRAAREEEVYGAFDAGRLVGIASFYRPADFIHSLYVAERGRGIGKALIDHLAATADGPLSLKVQAPNRHAREFYRRQGFREVERGREPPPGFDWCRLVRDRQRRIARA